MVRKLLKKQPMISRNEARGQQGFTLTELMIVVVILGILAAIAIISFRKYVQYSKTSEVYTVLGDIRAKQEGYRAEFSQYCAVNGSNLTAGHFPAAAPDRKGNKHPWNAPPLAWQQLGFSVHGSVYAGYSVAAGLPGQTCGGCPSDPAIWGDHWWAAWAHLDMDGDGDWSTFEALHLTTDIAAVPSEYE
jgi:type IV pilus assembly protein PilA